MSGAGRVPPRGFAFLLRLYPRSFRARFGQAMSETFTEELADARGRGGKAVAALWALTALRIPMLALEEHMRIGRHCLRRLFAPPARGIAWVAIIDSWAQDVRIAIRGLLRAPGFAAATVLTIGLGAGATTTLFSLTNALLFRPLPVASPEHLVRVQERREGRVSTGMEGMRLPYARYQAYEESTRDVFSGLAAQNLRYFSMRSEGPAFRVATVLSSENYFDVLGVRPAAGRFFVTDDEPVVVLSHRLWQQRFGGSPDVVGRPIYLNGYVMTIAGVAESDFGGTVGFMSVDLWVPYGAHGAAAWPDAWVNLFGRLRSGIEPARASAVVNAVALRTPPDEPNTEVHGAHLEAMTGTPAGMLEIVGGFLRMLVATAALVLLIASANIAGMLIARAVTRRREVAIRLALGSARARLVRQLLTEAAVLFMMGGVAGIVLAVWATRLLARLREVPTFVSISIDATPDLRVLAFSLGITLFTGVLFALIPALQASRPALVPALRDGGRTETTRTTRARGAFVVAQIAMSVVLLVAAGLFGRTLQRALATDPGFTPDGVIIATINLAPHGYDEDRGRLFHSQLVERVRALPGVEAAALAGLALLTGRQSLAGWRAGPDEPSIQASLNTVDAGYFETLRIPLVAGRGIDETDVAGAPAAIVVNQTFAERLWPGENPIGKVVMREGDRGEVVGVARDGMYANFGEQPKAFVFLSAVQHYSPRRVLHARARPGVEAADIVAGIRLEVAALDADIAVESAMPLTSAVGSMLFPQRFAAVLIGIFGVIGLALAGIGVYGVLANNVAQRSRELGIRVALGADTRKLLRLVLASGALLAAIGGAFGLAAAAALTRFLGGLLHGLSPLDPFTFAIVPLVLAAVALLASYLPARRALRTDPIEALRQE